MELGIEPEKDVCSCVWFALHPEPQQWYRQNISLSFDMMCVTTHCLNVQFIIRTWMNKTLSQISCWSRFLSDAGKPRGRWWTFSLFPLIDELWQLIPSCIRFWNHISDLVMLNNPSVWEKNRHTSCSLKMWNNRAGYSEINDESQMKWRLKTNIFYLLCAFYLKKSVKADFFIYSINFNKSHKYFTCTTFALVLPSENRIYARPDWAESNKWNVIYNWSL